MRESKRGSVARTIPPSDLQGWRQLASLIVAGRIPIIAFASRILGLLSGGVDTLRSREAARTTGPLAHAVVYFLALDAREDSSRATMKSALRTLTMEALDAWEDIVGENGLHLSEAERMFRRGVLASDWSMDYEDGAVQVRVSMALGVEA